MLTSSTDKVMMPAYMLIVAGVVGGVALLFMPEVAGTPLPGTGPIVETEKQAREVAENEHGDSPSPNNPSGFRPGITDTSSLRTHDDQ